MLSVCEFNYKCGHQHTLTINFFSKIDPCAGFLIIKPVCRQAGGLITKAPHRETVPPIVVVPECIPIIVTQEAEPNTYITGL